jgi:predicted aspartyl protease
MITGVVNEEFEPIISISLYDSEGNVYTQDAIIDTCFNGWRSLPFSKLVINSSKAHLFFDRDG